MNQDAQQILHITILLAYILGTVIFFVWLLLPFYLLSRLKKIHTTLISANNTLERIETKLVKQNALLEINTKK